MSGETDASVSGWTTDTLKAYFERVLTERSASYQERFDGQEHAVEIALAAVNTEFHEHLIQYRREVDQAFEASDKAITKAEMATDKRFESINEFRGQLRDQQADFLTRPYYEARHHGLEEAIQAMQIAMKDLMTRAEGDRIADAAQLDRATLRTEIADLRESRSQIAGGSAALWRAATFVVSAIATLTAIYLIVHH